jgi:hypothetical protein
MSNVINLEDYTNPKCHVCKKPLGKVRYSYFVEFDVKRKNPIIKGHAECMTAYIEAYKKDAGPFADYEAGTVEVVE